MRIIAYWAYRGCAAYGFASQRQARLTVFRTYTRGCRYALLHPIIDGGVAGDASSRGVDGTADEAHLANHAYFRASLLPATSTYEEGASRLMHLS